MHPIIYDVAVTLDGYISGPTGDVSMFSYEGPVVDDYAARMAGYATAIMGRETYIFGYDHGMAPGQNPYPQMKTVVFSSTLDLPATAQVQVERQLDPAVIKRISDQSDGPVYLCGGGRLAGWMLREGLIDTVILKRAPCLAGTGTGLFGGLTHATRLTRLGTKSYDDGYLLEEFAT